MRLDTNLLDDIRLEIDDRIERVLKPAVEEYDTLTATLAALNGEEPMNTKQKARRQARRKAHHNESMARTIHKPTRPQKIYLTDEQVAEIKTFARSKKRGIAWAMEKHGYVHDGKGWTPA